MVSLYVSKKWAISIFFLIGQLSCAQILLSKDQNKGLFWILAGLDSSDFAENFETKKAILRIVGRGQRYQEQLEVVFC